VKAKQSVSTTMSPPHVLIPARFSIDVNPIVALNQLRFLSGDLLPVNSHNGSPVWVFEPIQVSYREKTGLTLGVGGIIIGAMPIKAPAKEQR
jgi:hypothetical protein